MIYTITATKGRKTIYVGAYKDKAIYKRVLANLEGILGKGWVAV